MVSVAFSGNEERRIIYGKATDGSSDCPVDTTFLIYRSLGQLKRPELLPAIVSLPSTLGARRQARLFDAGYFTR